MVLSEFTRGLFGNRCAPLFKENLYLIPEATCAAINKMGSPYNAVSGYLMPASKNNAARNASTNIKIKKAQVPRTYVQTL